MKIQSEALTGANAAETSRVQDATMDGRGAGRPRMGSVSHATDSIAVSSLASRIAEVSEADGIRMAGRVSQLAALYARGEYRPDALSTGRAIVSRTLSESNGGGQL